MFRRNFIQRIALMGSTGLTAAGGLSANGNRTVTYRITGFSCVTCAVGLETMLRQEKGVVRAEASYPKANVLIEFNPTSITEEALKGFISNMGFGVKKFQH